MNQPSVTTAAPSSAPQLLISVRDIHEATLVAEAGVDVIDFKEPRRGALAPVEPEIWNAASTSLRDRSLSAALGESNTASSIAALVPNEFRFAKVGPSGLRSSEQLRCLWDSLPLPPTVELVPVSYADHEAAGCLAPADVLATVIESGHKRLLIDTFSKNGQSLTDHLSDAHLASLLKTAHNAGIWIALAGSIQLPQAQRLHEIGIVPGCWGVRGDVCRPNESGHLQRTGSLDPNRVLRWEGSLRLTGGFPITAESKLPAPR
ncbi:(5-formylfuran-3-yl)methyl phosphate synthase [Rhodopirellula sp. SWK7]|uniref:(5-formylfuran-3-yl)methyl phosphate synthase n=1 Tax=Rhodopirellula sp. SWK7 TaxID=595460 RepID=UPI0009FF0F52|nr:(5-formylfuran-3-yl)methyl phosphate synthase [Rhodopirellula sp. SWK7]